MNNTLIIQIITLLLIVILPIRSSRRAVLLLILLSYSYKSLFITIKLLELVGNILIGRGRSSYRNIASKIFMNNFRLRNNFQELPNNPTILVTTYPITLLEYLVPILIPGNTCLLASGAAKKWMDMVYTNNQCCYIPIKKGGRYDAVKEIVRERLKNSHIIMYVEDKERRYGRSVGNLWKGAFNMAKELGATITPLVIDNVLETMWYIPQQNFEIFVGPTISVLDPVSTLIEVRTLMREKKRLFKNNKFMI